VGLLKKIFPRKFRHFLLGLLAKSGFATGKMLPRSIGLALFSAAGAVCYYLLPKDRKQTIRNLKIVFGEEWSDKKIRATAKAVFVSLGKNLFDAVHLKTVRAKKFYQAFTHDDLSCIAEVKKEGKGAVFITAHLGCFEMLLHYFARSGFDGVIVGRAFKNTAIDEVVRKMRSGPGIEYIDRSEDPRKIVRRLREGKMMGALIDQDTNVEGVFADFLGYPAFTPSSAVRFAMKFGMPVIVSVTARTEGGKHHVFVSDRVTYVKTDDFEADLLSVIQKINGIIGGYIRKYPEQWVWMHDRWKTKPPVKDTVDK